MILDITAIQQNNPKDCAVTCVVMTMEYFKKKFSKREFLKKLESDEYGYSLIDIARELRRENHKIQFGFWDKDLIKKEKIQKIPISLKDLEDYSAKIKLHKVFERYLEEILRFYQKEPSSIEIAPVTSHTIDKFLEKNVPVIIHVDVKKYHDKTDDSIHSILIVGKKNDKYYIVDPLLGKRIIKSEKLLAAWKAAGGYFLVIFKKIAGD